MFWKNPEGCENVLIMENNLEKIRTVVTLSGKWEMIWKSLESCETVRKTGIDLEKSGQL